jgi:hypothetical protein
LRSLREIETCAILKLDHSSGCRTGFTQRAQGGPEGRKDLNRGEYKDKKNTPASKGIIEQM